MPTDESVIEEIRHICGTQLDVREAVGPSTDLIADLELDSLGLITLAVALEDRYRVKLAEADATGIRTVGELAALVCRRAAEAAP